jgi:hypothetical protein
MTLRSVALFNVTTPISLDPFENASHRMLWASILIVIAIFRPILPTHAYSLRLLLGTRRFVPLLDFFFDFATLAFSSAH